MTEQITGVNLPVAQLNVAIGIRLHPIPMIRQYFGEKPYRTSPIDFANRKPRPLDGPLSPAESRWRIPRRGSSPPAAPSKTSASRGRAASTNLRTASLGTYFPTCATAKKPAR
jgi:hypothetical protein